MSSSSANHISQSSVYRLLVSSYARLMKWLSNRRIYCFFMCKILFKYLDERCRASKECVRCCRSCGLPITDESMTYIGKQNSSGCSLLVFHPECLCCPPCGRPFTDPQQLVLVEEGTLAGTYHKSCLSSKCVVCRKSFSPDENLYFEMFWGNTYCRSHEHDNTAQCCSCGRRKPWNTKYTSLPDGRSVCPECLELAIMDTDDCQQLYRSVRGFFKGLNMRIAQKKIPVHLDGISTLKEAFKDLHPIPDLLGVCTSRVDTHTGKHVVKAIRVLYGLPRLLMGKVLANALMHAWFNLNGLLVSSYARLMKWLSNRRIYCFFMCKILFKYLDERCRASKECVRCCRSCGLPITDESMTYIGKQNSSGCSLLVFHPECLCCPPCGRPFTDPQQLVLVEEGTLAGTYHKSCLSSKCVVCRKSFSPDENLYFEMFWGNTYCRSHEHDNTAQCCSCGRRKPWNTKYTSLPDGRSVCPECLELAIMDTDDCQQLYRSVRGFFKGLNMRIAQKKIPVHLDGISTLKEAFKDLHPIPDLLGVCTSRVDTHTGKHVVKAIRVLYGLPRLLMGKVLANALMHAWFNLNGYQNISLEVREGICEVLSHMWLESQVLPEMTNMPSTPSSSSPCSSSFEDKLRKCLMYYIAHNKSPIYGGGYRDAMSAVKKYGLHDTLDHIRRTGTLPKVVL